MFDKTKFHWCCGIEDTFISDPYPKTGKTLDEYELTDHYKLWRSDIHRVKSLGVDSLRWGIPWYKIEPERGVYDWSWTDEVIPYIVEEKGITLILDFMHYGTPLWMKDSFFDPDYPNYVVEYTAKVTERYRKYLEAVVPFNEPHTACEFAGRRGEWPPYASGYEGYLKVFKAVTKGAIRQTEYLHSVGVETIQVECSGGAITDIDEYRETALIETTVQSMFYNFLSGDLSGLEYFFPFLEKNGIDGSDLDWFSANGTDIGIMGINFYPQFSINRIVANGEREKHILWVDDLAKLLCARYERFGVPMMITETSGRDNQELKSRWLKNSTDEVLELRDGGLDVIGYTWFPIIDMYDWDYRTSYDVNKENFSAKFGFWSYSREENPLAQQYREIINKERKGSL